MDQTAGRTTGVKKFPSPSKSVETGDRLWVLASGDGSRSTADAGHKWLSWLCGPRSTHLKTALTCAIATRQQSRPCLYTYIQRTTMRTSPRLGAFLMTVTIASMPLHADDVEPGIDPWITGCGDASDLLTLPAGFFGAHSDPLAQTVTLRGTPLPSLDGPSLGRIDTVVRRLESADLDECGDSDKIDIQIVALRLESPTPLVVTYNGGHSPEKWDLEVCLSEEHSQSTSSEVSEGSPKNWSASTRRPSRRGRTNVS